MQVVARGPQSTLEDAQVAAIRLRWEREKRKQAAQDAPKKAKRRTPKAEAAPASPVVESRPTKRRRTAAEVAESEAQLAAEAERAAAEEVVPFELQRPTLPEWIEAVPSV